MNYHGGISTKLSFQSSCKSIFASMRKHSPRATNSRCFVILSLCHGIPRENVVCVWRIPFEISNVMQDASRFISNKWEQNSTTRKVGTWISWLRMERSYLIIVLMTPLPRLIHTLMKPLWKNRNRLLTFQSFKFFVILLPSRESCLNRQNPGKCNRLNLLVDTWIFMIPQICEIKISRIGLHRPQRNKINTPFCGVNSGIPPFAKTAEVKKLILPGKPTYPCDFDKYGDLLARQRKFSPSAEPTHASP